MQRCPNCSRPTKRTEDWACQWCGYPLISKSYKKIPKTFRQLKEDRLPGQKQKSCLSKDTPTTIQNIVIATEGYETTKIELTIEEVFSVCTLDKVKAATLFKNRILALTGAVANVVVDYDNDIYYVSLSSLQGKEECNVNCIFDKKNSSELNLLTEGQKVTVEGKYDDYELNILIKDCVLVCLPKREETPTTFLSSAITSVPTPTQEAELETIAEPAAEIVPESTSEPELVAKAELEPEPEPEPAFMATEVTVDGLLSAYTTDEVAASERYGHKLLKVTGVVNRIEIQEYLEFDYINLTNIENNRLEHIRCFFNKEHEPELNQLTKGQKITVQGTFVGSIVSMHLRGCTLVS